MTTIKKTAALKSKKALTRVTGPVTLHMVAVAAGVSPSTVSRILNGTAVVSELKKKAVIYINSDSNGRGFLSVGGSHAYQHFVNQVRQRTRSDLHDRLVVREFLAGRKAVASLLRP